jgi:CheY-like chemotaxis protein
MTKGSSVLIVDDQIGDIGWLIDLIQDRGYAVALATNEEAAQKQLDAVKQGKASYALAIVDVMVAIQDLMDLIALDDQFFDKSQDTGIRLCEYARRTLGLSADELPIVCITIREDSDVRADMKRLGIPLFNRASSGKDSIRQFIEDLPPAAT